MGLLNKTALITGGSKGIGLGIAEALLSEGMNVCITARNAEIIAQKANELNARFPGKVLGVSVDVRNHEGMQEMIAQIVDKWTSLDVVIANAGVGHFASIEDMTLEQWTDTIDINLTGVFNTVKPSIEALKKSKGYIFTIASLAGANFFPRGAAYNASKFGLVGFTQAMMLDLRNYGIKVSTLMPGSVTSHFNNHTPSDADAWKIQPEDLGQIIVDLLKIHPRTLPSKVEIRPSIPRKK